MQDIPYSVHIFKEGDMYVAHVPELTYRVAELRVTRRAEIFEKLCKRSWKPVRRWERWERFSTRRVTLVKADAGNLPSSLARPNDR